MLDPAGPVPEPPSKRERSRQLYIERAPGPDLGVLLVDPYDRHPDAQPAICSYLNQPDTE